MSYPYCYLGAMHSIVFLHHASVHHVAALFLSCFKFCYEEQYMSLNTKTSSHIAGNLGKVLIWQFGKLGKDCQIKTHQCMRASMVLRIQIAKFKEFASNQLRSLLPNFINARQNFPLYGNLFKLSIVIGNHVRTIHYSHRQEYGLQL